MNIYSFSHGCFIFHLSDQRRERSFYNQENYIYYSDIKQKRTKRTVKDLDGELKLIKNELEDIKGKFNDLTEKYEEVEKKSEDLKGKVNELNDKYEQLARE